MKRYQKEKAEWDAGGRGRADWENWQARLREEAKSRAARDLRIYMALFGRISTFDPPKPKIDPKLAELLRAVPPPAPREEVNPRDIALRLNRMSTINCHQPQNNNGGFKLSLSGYNGGRFDDSRLLDILSNKPAGGSMGGAGVNRK